VQAQGRGEVSPGLQAQRVEAALERQLLQRGEDQPAVPVAPVHRADVHPLDLADPVTERLYGTAGHRAPVDEPGQVFDAVVQRVRDVLGSLGRGYLVLVLGAELDDHGVPRMKSLDVHWTRLVLQGFHTVTARGMAAVRNRVTRRLGVP